jgi:LDH2 family malate/lactate/ureidoglycolate dehydrogenase
METATRVDRVYLPGEREALLLAERRRDGLPLGVETWRELVALGKPAGIAPPALQ